MQLCRLHCIQLGQCLRSVLAERVCLRQDPEGQFNKQNFCFFAALFSGCIGFSWDSVSRKCWLKGSAYVRTQNSNFISKTFVSGEYTLHAVRLKLLVAVFASSEANPVKIT